jgi:GT2 family glycosyltransferase
MNDVSVVIPFRNGWDVLEPCLRSIPLGIETIAVDDGCTDDTPVRVAQFFPAVQVLRNEQNLGFAATANRGLAACTRPVRVVLNSDARLQPGALAALASAFEDREIGIAGPRLVFPDGTHQVSAARFPSPGRLFAGSFFLTEVFRWLFPRRQFPFELGLPRIEHDADRDVDWVEGACIALRDDCFAVLGGFDEGYHYYSETDLCWRAHLAGWRVRYVSGAEVKHVGGASSGRDAAAQARQLLRSEARFFSTAYGQGSMRRWYVARMAGSLTKVLVLALPALVDRRVRVRWRWQAGALAEMVRNLRTGEWRGQHPPGSDTMDRADQRQQPMNFTTEEDGR